MSAHAGAHHPAHAPHWPARRTISVSCLGAAAVGALLFGLGIAIEPRRAWFAYLDAWTFGVGIGIGGLLLLMAGHASKASWMAVTRRLSEAIAGVLPLFLILFLPLIAGLPHIYPWAAHAEHLDPIVRKAIEHKQSYLNAPFFVARSLGYLVVFVVIGALLRAWSTANDRSPSLAHVHRLRRLSGGALPLVALTVTWASFDWTMSLEPQWFSTIFGLYFFAGAFVGAIALVCILLHFSRLRSAPRAAVTKDHGQAIGRLLFAMLIFWAYMAFSQLLIQWIGNVPAETSFYRARIRGSWSAVDFVLVIGHFFLPFFLLLPRLAKGRSSYLASIGAWIFVMHYVDVYWLILPVCDTGGLRPDWLDLAGILLVGGLSCVWILHAYFAAPPIPKHLPDLEEGLEYEAGP